MNTQAFLDEVSRHLCCDRERAEAVSFIVLRALRSRLPEAEASDLREQLADGVRRLFDESHGDADPPVPGKKAADLIAYVQTQANLAPDGEAERAVRAVFKTLQVALASPTGIEGEAWDVLSVLPKEWQQLWITAGFRPDPDSVD